MTKIKMIGLLAVAALVSATSQAALVHRYSFTTNANDSVGTAHGVLRGNASINGGAVVLDGVNSYVDFPNGILTNLTSITMEFWLTDNGSGAWSRIYDFGNASAGEDFAVGAASSGTAYMFLTPRSGTTTVRGAYTVTGGGAGEQIVEWGGTPLPTGVQKHVVWTSDAASQTARIYVDGVQVGINTGVSLTPAALGNTVNNWLGRSQFNADAFLKANVTEFRMYDVALTQQQIQDDLNFGPDVATQQGPANFAKQPQNQTVTELLPVTFTSSVNGTPPYGFQWSRNDVVIPGATNSTYTISSASLGDNGASFNVVVSNNFNGTPTVITSTDAVLTVNPDTTAPVLIRAASIFPNGLLVEFSEPVRPETGTSLANYSITSTNGSVAVTNAVMGSGNTSVLLGTTPQTLGTLYTLTVNNLRDFAAANNSIAPNSQTTFLAVDLLAADIGNPSVPGTLTSVPGGYDITGSGSGIGNKSDQFSFNYQLRNGDFDVQSRIASISMADSWFRAGLMARETLATNSVFAAAIATPSMNGEFFQYRAATGGASVNTGTFPANYPNAWLRLQRVGNVFTGYASYDGQTWMQLGSVTLALPSSIYVGLAVSGQSGSQPVLAQVRDFAPVTGGTIVGQIATPYEPLGPSSRLTGLTFSEIMYKPAKRSDLRNIEYVEIYNSNPYFHDMSGYRLSGDVDYTFPPGTTIPGGGFKVVAFSPADVQAVYGISGVMGPYTNSLKRAGTVRLRDEQNAILLEVNYSSDNPWPVAAEGTGHSIVLARPSYGENDPRAWAISDVVGGTPGASDSYRPSPLRNVVINEIFAYDAAGVNDDYVELYNHSNQAVDISGCILTDDATTNKYVVPAGVVLPARGFAVFNGAQLGFGLSSGGETVFFKNPSNTRILDALQFEAQADGVSFGRYPDGASQLYPMASRTPGLSNSVPRVYDVVLNELMYNPISGKTDDQFVELYNKGTNAVNLSGWQFTAGINFTFPSNTVLLPDGYVVVAANKTNLLAKYSNLNPNNTFGDFSGKLSKSGERIAIAMPQAVLGTNALGALTTNIIYPVIDEVTYSDGGRWGKWANGGGSSLELTDPRSNHRLAANWGDSDDTAKSSWTNVEATGVLDNGANYDPSIDYVQIGLLDEGECLVDNLEVRPGTAGPNYVSNPDLEAGAANWNFMGSHSRSSLETNAGYASAVALHLRASDSMWTGINAAQVTLTNTTLVSGNTATLRYKARWLHGRPEPLMRLHGNWLEAPGILPVPPNLGTPGARNSIALTNAAPAIYEVAHSPAVPAANQPVVVTARVEDSSGLQSLTLNYRIDPATTYTSVPMVDNGTGGDAVAGDGIYSATIPGNAVNVIVPFFISATDGFGAGSRFPALTQDNAPVRECVVLFGDEQPAGSFGTYHLWLTQTNINRWINLGVLGNEGIDGTFVYNNRIVYNMSSRYAGSPYHQSFNSPYGNACHYTCQMPNDDMVLGTTSFSKIHWPGNDIQDDAAGTPNDATLQREQASNALLRGLGIPWIYRRYVAVYVNGHRRNQLMEDSRVPNSDVMKSQFPDDSNSFLFKLQPWFETAMNQNSDHTVGWANEEWCYLLNWTTTTGKKQARYRWHYQIRQTPDSASNYTNVYQLVDAASAFTNANYANILQNVADMENWMRLQAANHAAGNWDCFGIQNGQNVYGYVSAETRWTLFMFDFNISLGNRIAWAPGANLFNNQDANFAQIYANPTFRRMYLRALKELTDGALVSANADPLLDAKYNAFVANGLNVSPPDSIKSYISQARASIATTVQAVNTNRFGTTVSNYNTSTGFLTIGGWAPLDVTTITVNGESMPVSWTNVLGWSTRLAAPAGSNTLTVLGYDRFGRLVNGASNQFVVVNSAAPVSPIGNVVFNEIMYNPVTPDAEYVELYNASTNTAFDLSGWRINGLGYTFPQGSVIAPNSFLVLAKSKSQYIKTYGLFTPVFDTFSGELQGDGETLTLIQPGPSLAQDVTVDKVRYESVAPWPVAAASLPGTFALQTIDPRQDRSRVGNWGGTSLWRYQTVTGAASSSRLLILMNGIGDLFFDDMKLVSGNVAEAGPNLLVNGDFEQPLSTGWVVPAGNGLTHMSVTNVRSGSGSLHLITTNASVSLANALFQNITPGLTIGQTYTLSYWFRAVPNMPQITARLNSSTLTVTHSVAPVPAYSPGTTNTVYGVLPAFPPLWLNELVTENQDGLTDGFGERDPWVELYNAGTNAISLAGYSLSPDYGNLTFWSFPSNTTINPGQFLVVWCDGQPEQTVNSELHANFRLSPGTGSIALTRRVNGTLQLLDYLNYFNLPANRSYGDYPDGQPFDRSVMFYTTPGGTNNGTSAPLTVKINEWMASNTRTLANAANGSKWDDWFELYNPSTEPANLEGYYLTDTLANKLQYRIPAGYVIPAGGYLLVWADGAPNLNSTNAAALHVPFQLSKSGEAIGLYAADGTMVDAVTFGAQTNDVAMGRFPDGAAGIYYLTTPTPTSANYLLSGNAAPSLAVIGNFTNYPGSTVAFTALATDPDAPGQTLTYSLGAGSPAGAGVDAGSGHFTWSIPANAPASTNSITLRVTDNGTPALSASRTFTVVVAVPLRVGSLQYFGSGQFGISWPSLPGKHYRVQYKNSLDATDWIDLGNVVPASNSSTTSISDNPGNAAQRFYRIIGLD